MFLVYVLKNPVAEGNLSFTLAIYVIRVTTLFIRARRVTQVTRVHGEPKGSQELTEGGAHLDGKDRKEKGYDLLTYSYYLTEEVGYIK